MYDLDFPNVSVNVSWNLREDRKWNRGSEIDFLISGAWQLLWDFNENVIATGNLGGESERKELAALCGLQMVLPAADSWF